MPGVHHHNHVRPARGPDLRDKTWGSAVGGFVLLFSFFIFVETKQNKTTEHKMDHFSHFRCLGRQFYTILQPTPKSIPKMFALRQTAALRGFFFFFF